MGDGGLSSLGRFSGRPQRRCRRRAHLTTIFLFLTSTRGRDYHFFVKGGNDSELNAGKVVQRRKAKSYNQKIGESEIMIEECAAWGVSSQVIAAYSEGVVKYLAGKD
jgi:hypothetical protein